MKRLLSLLAGITLTLAATAQTDAALPEQPHVKTRDNYLGVQLNALIAALLHPTNNSAFSNPYMITYTNTGRKKLHGFRAGIGFLDRSTTTTNFGSTTTVTNKNFNLRIGYEKAFQLSDKIMSGVGVDLLAKRLYEETKMRFNGIDDQKTSNSTFSVGGGGMGWVRYKITESLHLGTETSLYFTKGIRRLEGQFGTGENESKVEEVAISVPVAIFVILKF